MPKKEILSSKQKNLAVQHNNLVEARYRLTLQEKRLVLWLTSQVQPSDEDFKEHKLKITEFAKLLEVSGENLYSRLKDICRQLMKRIITINPIEAPKKSILVAWLGAAVFGEDGKGDGTISLSFHPHLKPFLLQLKERFTVISIQDVMQLRSVYSVRLFELLKQYQSIGERHFSIQEIRDFCGIEDKKYTNIQDIKRKVLDIAQREINEKTDIFIEFEFTKTSRKFTGVDFTIKTNRNYKNSGEEALKKERINQLRSEFDTRKRCIEFIINIGFSNSTVEKMIQHLGDYDLENAVKSVQMQIERGNVLNTKAMIRTAIKERWKPDVFLNKNN